MTKTYEEEVCASGACSKHRSCSGGSAMTDSERTKCDEEVRLYNEYDRLKAEKVGMDQKIKTAKEAWYKAAFNDLSRYDADAKREGKVKAKEIVKEDWSSCLAWAVQAILQSSNSLISFTFVLKLVSESAPEFGTAASSAISTMTVLPLPMAPSRACLRRTRSRSYMLAEVS